MRTNKNNITSAYKKFIEQVAKDFKEKGVNNSRYAGIADAVKALCAERSEQREA